jgi:hypothetical protein
VKPDAPAADGWPILRVISGDASPEELAAVVAAISSAVPDAGAARPVGDAGTTSVWAASAWARRQVRATFTPGPHAWRTSSWPR